ncbi:MAG: copper amine oxidase N-terminal domain-containing protein [Armatimonadota bacterium]
MEVKALKRYGAPGFPTRELLDEHPELLRLLPRRWRQQALILAAVTAVGALAAGCRTQVSAAEAQPAGTPAPPPPAPSLVAPVFQHGDGHGFFGGKPAPTYFLTEEEARQVVVEEGKRAGIEFTADGLELPDIALPVTYRQDPGGPEQPADTHHGLLVLDGADAKRQIAYEYVSQADFTAWEGKSEIHSTAWEENLQAAAKGLRDGLAAANPAGAFGVFYDPIVKSLPEEAEGTAAFTKRTLAPLSKFQGWEGWTAQFDEKAGVVTFTGKRTIVLKIDSAQATVDGRTFDLPAAPQLRYGSPYLPLEWTADALGGTVRARDGRQVSLRAPSRGYEWTDGVHEVTLDGAKDPVTVAFSWHDENTRRAMALETARTELRAQVRDFINWLKAEGVI